MLSEKIETLPETFQKSGFRTAGFTGGGYTSGDHGFARGFDEWNDKNPTIPQTLEAGVEFLERLGEAMVSSICASGTRTSAGEYSPTRL